MIASCEKVLTIHVLSSNEESLLIGGRDNELRNRIYDALTKAEFASRVVTQGDKCSDMNLNNICNRGAINASIQLEIKDSFRKLLRSNNKKCKNFLLLFAPHYSKNFVDLFCHVQFISTLSVLQINMSANTQTILSYD